jgi:ribosomal subunit interface protein
MKISVSCKHDEWRQAVEVEVARQAGKIEKLLKRYSPDLAQLHGSFEKQPRKSEFTFSLNLSLPTGTLHATGGAAEARTSVRQAFTELEMQLKKHKSKVRHDYQWKRKRPRVEVA